MKNLIIAVNKLNASTAKSISKLATPDNSLEVIILRDKKLGPIAVNEYPFDASVVAVDYFNHADLVGALSSLRPRVLGIVSRGEGSMQYLARVADVCRDWDIALPTRQSIEDATDKQQMRQCFLQRYPEISPNFMEIKDGSDQTLADIEAFVGLPLVIKPANLASSLLIQKCDSKQQLRQAVSEAFEKLANTYEEGGRYEQPTIIAEQYLDGSLYSTDVYIGSDGTATFCPLVEYVTGQSLGIDDFFLYRRSVPTAVDQDSKNEAIDTARKAITALDLKATTAHVELCHTAMGWKIIEVAPRLGRYRNEMYHYGYDIEHSDNDIAVRLGKKPIISESSVGFCSAYSIYPSSEGILQSVSGIDDAKNLKSQCYFRRLISDGEMVYHAKHGGHAIAEIILASSDKIQFERDSKWLETHVAAMATGEVAS